MIIKHHSVMYFIQVDEEGGIVDAEMRPKKKSKKIKKKKSIFEDGI